MLDQVVLKSEICKEVKYVLSPESAVVP